MFIFIKNDLIYCIAKYIINNGMILYLNKFKFRSIDQNSSTYIILIGMEMDFEFFKFKLSFKFKSYE